MVKCQVIEGCGYELWGDPSHPPSFQFREVGLALLELRRAPWPSPPRPPPSAPSAPCRRRCRTPRSRAGAVATPGRRPGQGPPPWPRRRRPSRSIGCRRQRPGPPRRRRKRRGSPPPPASGTSRRRRSRPGGRGSGGGGALQLYVF